MVAQFSKRKAKSTTEKVNVLLNLFHTAMIEGQKDSEAGEGN